jgi:hypothetical protein
MTAETDEATSATLISTVWPIKSEVFIELGAERGDLDREPRENIECT